MDNIIHSEGIDIPIARLRPLRDRKVTVQEYSRILNSIKASGLLEPLVVFPDCADYVILDGVQRYRILLEMGVEMIPCILGRQREAFTPNRMVNRVSPVQESRMIQTSLQELDEDTIAATFGLSRISHRLSKGLLKRLDPDVATALDAGKISKACAQELTFVKPVRQKEILTAMEGYKDFSVAFARTLILKTPVALRDVHKRKLDPWDQTAKRKGDLLKQLADAEQKHDFYTKLYKQYTIDLLRLAIFARSLLTNPRVRAYLNQYHAAIVVRFETIIADARG